MRTLPYIAVREHCWLNKAQSFSACVAVVRGTVSVSPGLMWYKEDLKHSAHQLMQHALFGAVSATRTKLTGASRSLSNLTGDFRMQHVARQQFHCFYSACC